MKKLIHLLILSCKRASSLVEKRNNFGLSAIERIQLRWHKKLCEACTAYEKQNELLEEALQKHMHDPINGLDKKLSNEEKNQIKEKI